MFSGRLHEQTGEFELLVTNENDVITVFNRLNKDKLSPFLHNITATKHFKMWCAKPSAGLIAANIATNPDFNRKFIRNGLGSKKLWYFLNDARVCNLPTNATLHKPDKSCRNCHNADEWNSHVLCGCPKVLKLIVARHERIVNIFEKFLRSYLNNDTNWEILRETIPPYFSCLLRPDFQIYNSNCDLYIIIDVKCPYDSDMWCDQY